MPERSIGTRDAQPTTRFEGRVNRAKTRIARLRVGRAPHNPKPRDADRPDRGAAVRRRVDAIERDIDRGDERERRRRA